MESMTKDVTSLSVPFIPGWMVSGDYKDSGLAELERVAFPFMNQLYRTALILTGSPHLAKDLLQATCLQAQHGHHRFHNDDDFGIWLFRILFDAFGSRRWHETTLPFRATPILRNNDDRRWNDQFLPAAG